MDHASLFSGVGGFDLASEWMGWNNKFNCEIDPFGQKVLKYYWPNAIQYGDIKTTDFTIWRGRIDILTGGFPCQPYSTAGKRLGKKDARHLWPEMLRSIREIRPRWIVGENVYGLLSWSKGLVFEEVQTDLENQGYKVLAFILPACGVNAPHERKRVWFIANSNDSRNRIPECTTNRNGEKEIEKRKLNSQPEFSGSDDATQNPLCDGRLLRELVEGRTDLRELRNFSPGGSNGIHLSEGDVTNTDNKRQEQQPRDSISNQQRQFSRIFKETGFESFPTQSPVRSRDDEFSSRLDAAALLNGRKPRSPYQAYNHWRQQSIKGFGNAVVPYLVLQIYKAIQEYEDYDKRPR